MLSSQHSLLLHQGSVVCSSVAFTGSAVLSNDKQKEGFRFDDRKIRSELLSYVDYNEIIDCRHSGAFVSVPDLRTK
jgi:hypothetical protein